MMYGRPSKDVSMSEAYPFPPTSPEDLYKPSSPSYISRSPSYVPYKGNWKSPVSGATVKAPSLSFTNPIYSPSFPIYVPRSSPLPGSPPTYSPTSPISKKTPAVTDKYVAAVEALSHANIIYRPAVKYTAEAQHFMEMMAASEKRALHVEDIPKPKLAASDAAKEDARWSLMKYEDWMPIIDLETGFKYYTDGLYDQEIGVREAETALQTRITDMFSSASTDSYEKFSKARSDAEAGLNRFTEKLRAYTGAAKLLESNLIIRAEIRKKSLVSKAEANIAEAMKLQPGLLETIGWASEEMEVAIRVVESKCAKIEAATSLEEVGDLMVDFVARVDKDSEELSDCDEEVDGTINTENRLCKYCLVVYDLELIKRHRDG
jgi:hypothetical protein